MSGRDVRDRLGEALHAMDGGDTPWIEIAPRDYHREFWREKADELIPLLAEVGLKITVEDDDGRQ